MRDHNTDNLNDPMDAYIRQGLKNWAAEEPPPTHVRTRILLVAASPLSQQEPRNSGVDEFGNLKTLFSENFPPDARLDAFKQPWFLAFHSSLSVMRHLP
jgi:hypothetical protein